MFSLRKLLVPIDFSDRSVAAAEHAAVMAARFDSELIFQHVVPPGPYEADIFEGGFNAAAVWPSRDEMEERLVEQMNRLIAQTARGRNVVPVISWGDAAAEIEELARHEQVDLLVMPSHGSGPFRRFLLGSVTQKVLHDVKFPILTGAHVEEIPEIVDDPYNSVLCAVDLGPHSEDVLRWAAGFAKAWEAELNVVHAAPPIDELPEDERFNPARMRQTINEVKMGEVRELLDKVGVKAARVDVDCAHAGEYVVAAAEETRADVLIVGRSLDDSFFGRLRATATELIRESPCPVISI